MSQSIRSNFLHLSALDSEPGSELQFETHQSNRVPRMFLVSFRVSSLNLAQASCMFLIPLVSFVNLAPSSRLHRCSMNLVWIVNRFSMILESFGGPKFHDVGVLLGSKIDKKSVLGGLLYGSWGGLAAILAPTQHQEAKRCRKVISGGPFRGPGWGPKSANMPTLVPKAIQHVIIFGLLSGSIFHAILYKFGPILPAKLSQNGAKLVPKSI